MKLTINMPWERDLSVNSYRFGKPSPKARGKWKKSRVRKPHVQAWHERAVWEIRLARQIENCDKTGRTLRWDLIAEPILPLRIRIDYRWPDNRRRDCDNYHKVIQDAVKAALGIDDRHFRITDGQVMIDKENPGFTVTITDKEG